MDLVDLISQHICEQTAARSESAPMPMRKELLCYSAASMDAISPDVRSSNTNSALISRLDKMAAAVESKPWVAIAAVCSLFVACSLLISATKLMWFDELHSYHIAQLPTVADLVGFYAAGLDIHTPVCALIERTSIALLGNNSVGLR